MIYDQFNPIYTLVAVELADGSHIPGGSYGRIVTYQTDHWVVEFAGQTGHYLTWQLLPCGPNYYEQILNLQQIAQLCA